MPNSVFSFTIKDLNKLKFWESKLLVHSSRINIFGCLIKALTIANLWSWPVEISEFSVNDPIFVCNPEDKELMKELMLHKDKYCSMLLWTSFSLGNP